MYNIKGTKEQTEGTMDKYHGTNVALWGDTRCNHDLTNCPSQTINTFSFSSLVLEFTSLIAQVAYITVVMEI